MDIDGPVVSQRAHHRPLTRSPCWARVTGCDGANPIGRRTTRCGTAVPTRRATTPSRRRRVRPARRHPTVLTRTKGLLVRRFPRTSVAPGDPMPRRHPWRRVVAAVAGLVLLLVAAPGAVAGPPGPAGAGDRALPAGFRHGWVEVEGTRLHYVRGGSGPALVLLHGWPQTWQAWRPVLPALRAGRTVVAFDLPGLGGLCRAGRRLRQGHHGPPAARRDPAARPRPGGAARPRRRRAGGLPVGAGLPGRRVPDDRDRDRALRVRPGGPVQPQLALPVQRHPSADARAAHRQLGRRGLPGPDLRLLVPARHHRPAGLLPRLPRPGRPDGRLRVLPRVQHRHRRQPGAGPRPSR